MVYTKTPNAESDSKSLLKIWEAHGAHRPYIHSADAVCFSPLKPPRMPPGNATAPGVPELLPEGTGRISSTQAEFVSGLSGSDYHHPLLYKKKTVRSC